MTGSKGRFITFDGPSGAGKSSLLCGVGELLREAGLRIHMTTEPSGSRLGQFARECEEGLLNISLACLMAADRYAHLSAEVVPALSEGKTVLSDRYVESSLVLQTLDGVDPEFIWALNSKILIPDLSVVVIAGPETLSIRLSQRSRLTRFERTIPRDEEVAAYEGVAQALSLRGFNVLLIENDSTPLPTNVDRVLRQIRQLQQLQ